MNKKIFVIILALSIVATYGATFIDALISNTLLGGEAGFPLKFSRATIFGGGTTDYSLMTLNIIFWFMIIWYIWKVLHKKKK